MSGLQNDVRDIHNYRPKSEMLTFESGYGEVKISSTVGI
jgi:hypothetical protein